MMRFGSFLTCSAAIMTLMIVYSGDAAAQYHEYTSGKPSVEVDLGQLEDDSSAVINAPASHAYERAPVLQAPLAAPDDLSDNIAPTAPRKRILKPSGRPPVQEGLTIEEKEAAMDFPPPIVETQAPPPSDEDIVEEPVKEPERKKTSEAPVPATPAPAPEFSTMLEDTLKENDIVQEVQEALPEASAPPVADTPAPSTSAVVPSLSDLTLEFGGNTTELSSALQAKLDEVANHLQQGLASRLQVRAFATGEDGTKGSARRIALARALSVRSYLMDKGIKPARVDVRALGTETDRTPLDRVDLVFVAP